MHNLLLSLNAFAKNFPYVHIAYLGKQIIYILHCLPNSEAGLYEIRLLWLLLAYCNIHGINNDIDGEQMWRWLIVIKA